MLDGTGDTPLHTLLAKDANPALVKAIIDFDPTLLCCENAVGRTPAEVAHDRYLSDNIKAPTRSRYRPDDSVTSLVSAFAGGFAKPVSTDNEAKEQEPKEHEPKTAVAKNGGCAPRSWRATVSPSARSSASTRPTLSPSGWASSTCGTATGSGS